MGKEFILTKEVNCEKCGSSDVELGQFDYISPNFSGRQQGPFYICEYCAHSIGEGYKMSPMFHALERRIVEKIKEGKPTIDQKVVRASSTGGAYFNFFRYGIDSLPALTQEGWRLIFIHDDKEQEHVTAVFERERPQYGQAPTF